MRKIVGITCSKRTRRGGPDQQAVNVTYIAALEAAGAAPVLLPAIDDADVVERYVGMVDGLLFSGGADIAPERYGEQHRHPDLREVDDARDLFEFMLIRRAVAADVPLLGICRGIQTLNVALGGTLYQDLPTEHASNIHHDQTDQGIGRPALTHAVAINDGTRLASLVCAARIETNSIHHQSVRDIADGLEVVARAEDGVVEAVENPAKRWLLAVQFHPEDMAAAGDEHARRIFRGFVEAL